MKKAKKISIAIILIILAMCQIQNQTMAYTKEEVKEIIDYHVMEEDEEEPEDYDVLVYLDDFEVNETIPCYKTSIDTVLYGKYGLFDINFFSSDLTNHKLESGENDKWVDIRNNVSVIFKTSRYIALAIMLTVLIYIALILVSSSLSDKNILPMSKQILNIIQGPQKSVKGNTIQTRLIEQWFISLLIIAIIPYVLSIIVYFSSTVTDIAYNSISSELKISTSAKTSKKTNKKSSKKANNKSKNTDDIDCNYIKVYAKYRIKPASTPIMSTNQTDLNGLEDTIKDLISGQPEGEKWAVYVQDLSSGTELVNINSDEKMSSASVIKLFIAAAYYDKASKDQTFASDNDEDKMSAMITVSDNTKANELADKVKREYINQYLKDNGYNQTELNREFLDTGSSKDNYTSAKDVGKLLNQIYNGKCADDGKILNYMKQQTLTSKIPAGLPDGVMCANKTGELGSNYSNGPVENDAAIVFKQDANYILVVMSSNLSSNGVDKIVEISKTVYEKTGGSTITGMTQPDDTEYTFKTSLEGLMSYETQYKSENKKLHAGVCFFIGIVLTAFKYFLFVLFIIRMLIIAVITATAPIIALINALLKITKGKSILGNILKIYLYFILLKPAIAVLYNFLVREHVTWHEENPIFILFAIIVIVVLIIWSYTEFRKSMNIKGFGETVKKKLQDVKNKLFGF